MYAPAYDIFVCGGSQHFAMLRVLLPQLAPYGRVHLGSITLGKAQLHELAPFYHVLHRPRHDARGYRNFNLFCIRDINRLARAPYFIKLDADIELADDWVDYVDAALARHPDAVLFGPHGGCRRLSLTLSGPLVRGVLGADLRVDSGLKVIGGFHVGKTAFFQRHDGYMQCLHELLYCFDDGRRIRPGRRPPGWRDDLERQAAPFTAVGRTHPYRECGNEDALRSLVAHGVGASARIHVLDAGRYVRVFRSPPPPIRSVATPAEAAVLA